MTVIKERLSLLAQHLQVLKDLRKRIESGNELVEDPVLRGSVERYLHLAVEALIDVGFRICSITGSERPSRYRDVARILKNIGFLSVKGSKLLEEWIGLRNILVHAYARIDEEKVFEALNSTEELRAIAEELLNSVSLRGVDPPRVDELDSLMLNIRNVLWAHPEVLVAYLFGSWVDGRACRMSDVDVAVLVSKELSWREQVSLAHEIEDRIGRSVDVVLLNKAPLTLAYEVISKGKVMFSRDENRRIEFEVRVLREYLDMKPRLEGYYRMVLTRFKKEMR